eukprot:m.91629 g.91629  ORF g.91629 m.91629 type:complete len:55 (+) comp13312_c0_seq5:820-984(+)
MTPSVIPPAIHAISGKYWPLATHESLFDSSTFFKLGDLLPIRPENREQLEKLCP